MFESILNTAGSSTLSFAEVILTILIAFISGGIISTTYRKTASKADYSQSFGITMILLPAVVSIIIFLIGSDIARAFSLAGAFSIIRFRSAPGEPKDIAYVLFAMASGLASGVGAFGYALLITVTLCVVMLVLFKYRFKSTSNKIRLLNITIPEDLDYEIAIEPLLAEYSTVYTLKKIKTTALGSLYQLNYELELKPDVSIKTFLDDLRCRNGNLNISLIINDLMQSEN